MSTSSIPLKPSKGRILVEPDPIEQQTAFGLLLPNNKEKPATGTVLVGNADVSAGTRILFSLFGLDEVKVNEKNYAIISDDAVLATYV